MTEAVPHTSAGGRSYCPACIQRKHEDCQKTLCKCDHIETDELSISHSRVESFMRCARQEYYSYGRKLQKQETSTALALGSAIHKVLETLYRHVLEAGMSLSKQRAAYPQAVKLALEKVEQLYKDGFEDSPKRAPLRLIIEKYLQREPFIDNAWREDDDRQWLILAVEKEFRLEWDPETHSSYPFVVDLIAKDPEGYTIVIDNKGVYDLYRVEETALMPQIPKYIGGLRALGYKVGNYGVYNMLRTRPDTKAGRPLQEWAMFLDFKIPAVRVQRSFEEQVTVSNMVHELDSLSPEERDRRAVRTNNKDTCTRMCDFRDLCVAELEGRNTAILLSSTYEPKKKRDKIEVSREV